MKLKEMKRTSRDLVHRRYFCSAAATRKSALELLYDISSIDGFSVECQRIDEPYEVDYGWSHFKGKLSDGVDRDGFVSQYEFFEIESLLVKGFYEGAELLICMAPPKDILQITCHEGGEEAADRFAEKVSELLG